MNYLAKHIRKTWTISCEFCDHKDTVEAVSLQDAAEQFNSKQWITVAKGKVGKVCCETCAYGGAEEMGTHD